MTQRRRDSQFKKRDSSRDGFTYLERSMINDKGVLVGPGEFDRPPPSDKSIGGEGEVTQGNTRSDYEDTDTPTENKVQVQYLTSSNSIKWVERTYRSSGENLNSGFFYITGSLAAVDIAVNPQITAAKQGQILTMLCIDSGVTLQDGNGLSLYEQYVMGSGDAITLIYNSGNTVWQETSRSNGFF